MPPRWREQSADAMKEIIEIGREALRIKKPIGARRSSIFHGKRSSGVKRGRLAITFLRRSLTDRSRRGS
jgi:hypothetical protein